MLRAGLVKAIVCVAVYANTGESLGQGVMHQLTLDDPKDVPSQQLREEVSLRQQPATRSAYFKVLNSSSLVV